MRDELHAKIESVCQAQSSRRQMQLDQEETTAISRSQLMDKFINVRRDVIRSVMTSFSCYFTDHFYDCRVVNDDVHNDQFGRRMFRTGITWRIYKGATLGDDIKNVPHYSVFWDDVNAVVRFYRSNTTKLLAGEAHFDGRADIHEITADLIERKLLGFTDWLFAEGVGV